MGSMASCFSCSHGYIQTFVLKKHTCWSCYLVQKIGLDSAGVKYNLLLHLILQCGRLSVFHSIKLLFVHWVPTCGLLCPSLQLR